MKITRSIELAATPDALKLSDAFIEPGARFGRFEVDSTKCVLKLGAWLAEHISTTRRDDDASRVSLVVPVTNAGALLTNLGKAIAGQTHPGDGRNRHNFSGYLLTRKVDLDRAIQHIRDELAFIEQQVAVFGDAEFRVKTADYDWPVFGSAAGGWAAGVRTPEAFFDFCARDILTQGFVVRWAGLGKEKLPESLAASMRKGRGLELLKEVGA